MLRRDNSGPLLSRELRLLSFVLALLSMEFHLIFTQVWIRITARSFWNWKNGGRTPWVRLADRSSLVLWVWGVWIMMVLRRKKRGVCCGCGVSFQCLFALHSWR